MSTTTAEPVFTPTVASSTMSLLGASASDVPFSSAAVPRGAPVRSLRLSRVVTDQAGDESLVIRGTTWPISSQSSTVQVLLHGMTRAAVDEIAAVSDVLAHDGPGGVARWMNLLTKLEGLSLLERSIEVDGAWLATLRPMGPGPSAVPRRFSWGATYRTSRFALVRVVEGSWLAQSPHSHFGVALSSRAAEALHSLSEAADPVVLLDRGLGRSAVEQLIAYFLTAGVVDRIDSGESPSDERRGLAQWNPFDLWLHSRVRGSRLVEGWGRTYPMKDSYAPLEAEVAGGTGLRVALPEPSVASPGRLHDALETRRSIREHDDAAPITLAQLGEFLHRTMRTKSIVPSSDDLDQLVDRPYPSGGALHELEVSLLIGRCNGLERGLWHYRSTRHELELAAAAEQQAERLLSEAQGAAMMSRPPQVLLIISARFGRIMWKYETIAYSLILKHVGVLMQTMYLVATDMGLAPCAIGGGDGAAFASLTGLDFLEHGSVGEFMLGSRPSQLTPGDLVTWKDAP